MCDNKLYIAQSGSIVSLGTVYKLYPRSSYSVHAHQKRDGCVATENIFVAQLRYAHMFLQNKSMAEYLVGS